MDNEQFNALLKWIQAIERHLNGIRTILTVLFVLVLPAIVVQACSALLH